MHIIDSGIGIQPEDLHRVFEKDLPVPSAEAMPNRPAWVFTSQSNSCISWAIIYPSSRRRSVYQGHDPFS